MYYYYSYSVPFFPKKGTPKERVDPAIERRSLLLPQRYIEI